MPPLFQGVPAGITIAASSQHATITSPVSSERSATPATATGQEGETKVPLCLSREQGRTPGSESTNPT